MNGGAGGSTPRIEVYVRSLRPGDRTAQRRALDTLDELSEGGEIAGYDVVVWGDRVPSTPGDLRTRAGRFVLDRVVVFQQWADRNDATIDSAFDVRTVDSTVTGEQYTELVLPRMVVAAVAGDQLLGVAPATTDGTHYSVAEFLDRVAAGDAFADSDPVELRPLDGSGEPVDARTAEDDRTAERLDRAVTALRGADPDDESDRRPGTDRERSDTADGDDPEEELAGDPSPGSYPPY